jgi:hypothetical protein
MDQIFTKYGGHLLKESEPVWQALPFRKRLRLSLLHFLAPPEEPEPFYDIVWQNGSSVLWVHM